MNYSDLIKARFSVRDFSDEKVTNEALSEILDAGHLAPTAKNSQPQRIIVINDDKLLDQIKSQEIADCYGAPLVLAICYDKDISWENAYSKMDFGPIDVSIVNTHMMLKAADIGLGSVWVGNFNPEKLIKLFNLPKNIIPVYLLAIGKPSETAKPRDSHDIFREKEKIISYNKI